MSGEYEIICQTCGEEIKSNSVYVSRRDEKLIFFCVGDPPSPHYKCIEEEEERIEKELDGGILGREEIISLLESNQKG